MCVGVLRLLHPGMALCLSIQWPLQSKGWNKDGLQEAPPCLTELVPARMEHKGFTTRPQCSMHPRLLCIGVQPEKVQRLGDANPHCPPMPPFLGASRGGQEQYGFASKVKKVFPVQDSPHWGGVERSEELQGGVLHPDPRPHRGG